jgi:hypothetical protein
VPSKKRGFRKKLKLRLQDLKTPSLDKNFWLSTNAKTKRLKKSLRSLNRERFRRTRSVRNAVSIKL